jgi:hypothetical protein
MKYQTFSHEVDVVIQDEYGRRVKLHGLRLQDEIASLKEQLAKSVENAQILSTKCDTYAESLHSTAQRTRQNEKQARARARELNNLKVWEPGAHKL